ncbi:MAG TPA: ubiquinone/menaquinone biosynthesis methyltransferase [Candidatus Acidoferrales bacterium]|nr:ubiquinone/menaquinone biosynthesis methyltransferase [Candidatus Acidoferrales bacterium]
MFRRIAPHYDFVSRAFSYGMDRRWKEDAVARASLPDNALVLDLASGSGDFSRIILERLPRGRSVAVDLTEDMLQIARSHGVREIACADVITLPFASDSFAAVVVGYGLRNFPDLEAAILEIKRVTRPGGRILSLDFFLPSNRILRLIYVAYLYANGIFWGTLLDGRPRTFTYIAESLRGFLSIDELSSLLRRNGYAQVQSRSYIFGGIGLHLATKP